MDELCDWDVELDEFFENMKFDEELDTEDKKDLGKKDLDIDADMGTFDEDIDEDILNALI